MANRSRKRERVQEDIQELEDDLEVFEDDEEIDEETAASKTIQTGYDNSRAAMMASAMSAMSGMNKDDLSHWLEQALALANSQAYTKDIGDDTAAKNAATIQMKGAVKEDIAELFGSEDLAEDFKERATTLFEAAVNARVIQETARLEDEFDQRLEEAVEEITEGLAEQVDKYLSYTAQEWINENEVAIENGIKSQLTEDFIVGLKNLFEEHYVSIPEESVDVVESLAEKVAELEEALNEQISMNMELTDIVESYSKDEIFDEVCEGLALTQVEKLRTLSEGVDFENDLDDYKKKLEIIREKYFGVKATGKTVLNEELEEIEEGADDRVQYVDENVKMYHDLISKKLK